MNHKLGRELKEIIARSYSSDNDERRLLEKIFFALAEHQENFLDALANQINAEAVGHDCEKDFAVAVKLVAREDTEARRGFFPVDSSCQQLFLDVRYEDVKNFCEPKIFRGQLIAEDGTQKNFSYSLQRHEKFIAQEKILFDIAALYKIRRPIIFSPYARKAVELVTEDELVGKVDLLLDENGLRGKLLTDRELCWNVQIDSGDTTHGGEPEEFFGADENLIRYEYFHTFDADEKIFVLPDQHCDDLHVVNSADERRIILGYNSVLKERACRIVRLHDFEISDDTFTNDFPRKNSTLRLRTEGDLEKVLGYFNATRLGKNFPAHFGGFGVNQNPRPIKIYRREDQYFIPTENFLLGRSRNKSTCFVKFFGDPLSKFKTDYANFVLHHLAQTYPEFTWAGVDA